jgi:hypothetical protein
VTTRWPGVERVELAGEWPPGAPSGTFRAHGELDELVIDHADPRLVIGAELVDHIVDNPHPRAFVDLAGCKDYMGALLKIRGVNRTVIYRLTDWYPSIRAFLGEFT